MLAWIPFTIQYYSNLILTWLGFNATKVHTSTINNPLRIFFVIIFDLGSWGV